MKVRFYIDSLANAYSCNKSEWMDISDYGYSDEEWKDLSEDDKYKVIEGWAFGEVGAEIGYEEEE